MQLGSQPLPETQGNRLLSGSQVDFGGTSDAELVTEAVISSDLERCLASLDIVRGQQTELRQSALAMPSAERQCLQLKHVFLGVVLEYQGEVILLVADPHSQLAEIFALNVEVQISQPLHLVFDTYKVQE